MVAGGLAGRTQRLALRIPVLNRFFVPPEVGTCQRPVLALALFPDQCDRVPMAILWGSPDNWSLDVWACHLGARRVWNRSVVVAPCAVV